MSIAALIDQQLPRAVELRHRLHQIPEIRYEEFATCAAIRAELDRLGIRYVDGVEGAPTATIAWLGEASRGCIGLRADIDGLPICEASGLPWASQHPGRMHACGHDGHSANLIGVAAMLKSMELKLPVCVKLIWQPAEEGGAGADRLVAAGVLDGRIGPKVEAIFGLHGWPGLKVGLVATKPGALLAATDSFTVQFKGKGCHGAYPHLGHDPIVAMAEAIVNLQQVVSRDIDPTDPAVVTVGIVNGGTAINVIPDVVEFSGTARSLHTGMRRKLREVIERRCGGIAAAHGCQMRFTWEDGYPPTTNDAAMAEYVIRIARKTLGEEKFIPVARPSMG
ncbi:MAG TPA: M20 family metallopeptidase, partial [Tepidisphaeraceae bacterium]|nr:M20 family metallopeptidase [Tepidisphaeraceae bacterium]